MSDAPTPGPEIDPGEDLYRCLTTKDWWVAEENRRASKEGTAISNSPSTTRTAPKASSAPRLTRGLSAIC